MLEGESVAPATMESADEALTTVSPETPATPAAEPAEQPTGQPRDEQGRFTSPPPTPEPEPAPAEVAPAETPGEPTTEPQAPADVEYPAFSYRADGQEFQLPGSAVGEDGVFIPADHIPELQQLLSAGKAAFGSVRQRLSEAADREKQAVSRAEAAEAQANHVLAHFEDLIQRSQGQDLTTSPLGQWLQAAAMQWPILQAEAKAKAVEMQSKATAEQLKRYQEQEQQARLEPVIQDSIRHAAQQYGARHGLDAEGIQDLTSELLDPKFRSLVIVKAPYDDPQSGIKQGELAIDFSVVDNAASRAAKWTKRATGQQQKITAAIEKNAKAEPPKAKIPPTVTKGGKAPRQGSPIPTFKTTKEADDWFLNGGGNDFE